MEDVQSRYPSADDQYDAGRALRRTTPRSSHSTFEAGSARLDPIGLLEQQAETRVTELVPIRYGRMAASPLAFLRGSAAVMAADLAGTPSSGIRVTVCGDCHLSNFGFFATPERNLVFDVNDFDEVLPAPFEWDVKRLAASLVVAGDDLELGRKQALAAAAACVKFYRTHIHRFAPMGHLETWYARLDVTMADELVRLTPKARKRLDRAIGKAQRRTSLHALERFTEKANGAYRIKDDPPLIQHVDFGDLDRLVTESLTQMRGSMGLLRHQLLDRYEFVDVALKVVGVGSVGTRAYMVLLRGKGDGDPLFLQFKQAEASVLEPYAGPSEYPHSGQRVVYGQRLMQAASDVFLGWITSPIDGTTNFYFRQLRDMKGGIDVAKIAPENFVIYAEACGAALARAHARSGEAATIAGYLGQSDAFDRAIVEFAGAYAEQTVRDHATLLEAIRAGRVEAQQGI